MSEHDIPSLDDVLTPQERAYPDHRDHAKTPKHVNDDALEERADIERAEVAEAQGTLPESNDIPAAED